MFPRLMVYSSDANRALRHAAGSVDMVPTRLKTVGQVHNDILKIRFQRFCCGGSGTRLMLIEPTPPEPEELS